MGKEKDKAIEEAKKEGKVFKKEKGKDTMVVDINPKSELAKDYGVEKVKLNVGDNAHVDIGFLLTYIKIFQGDTLKRFEIINEKLDTIIEYLDGMTEEDDGLIEPESPMEVNKEKNVWEEHVKRRRHK